VFSDIVSPNLKYKNMSVNAKLRPIHSIVDSSSFRCIEQLNFDGDYRFFGQFIDMSLRRSTDPLIPEKPLITLEKMSPRDTVWLDGNLEGISGSYENRFHIGRSEDWKKIDATSTSAKNKAIVEFIRNLPPETLIIVEMSW